MSGRGACGGGQRCVIQAGCGHRPVAPLGCAYHVDPLLLAIQVLELVWADVNQGAQVTVVSPGEERGGRAQAQAACVSGLASTTVCPPQEMPLSEAALSPRAKVKHRPWSL